MPHFRLHTFPAVSVLLFLPLAANALDSGEGTQTERFTLERDGDRFVRLDKQTGAISVCTFNETELLCRKAVDDRDAVIDEVDRLTRRIEELEARLAENGIDGDSESKPLTDEELDTEFEKALDYSTRAMRKFFEAMKDLRKELNEEAQ